MATTFLKSLFKTKKTGENDKSRISQIERLKPDQTEQREQLLTLARNSEDASLRLAAIERLDRIEWLIPLYDQASHRERSFIAQRVETLVKENADNLQQAKESFSDSRMRQILDQLTSASEGNPVDVCAQSDPRELERLAIEGQTASLRKSALDKVSDEEALTRIARAAKGRDKTIYQTARQKLQVIRQREADQQRQEEEIAQLLKNLADHAKTENLQLYQARLDALLQHWASLQSQASEAQKAEFQSSLEACHQRLTSLKAAAASEQAEQDKREERQATLELLERTQDELQDRARDQATSIASLDALIKTQENRWLEATRDTTVDRHEQKHYQDLMLSLRQFLQASQHLEREKASLEQSLSALEAVDPEDSKHLQARQHEIRQALENINWPDSYPEPELLQHAREQLGAVRAEQKRAAADQKARTGQLRKVIEQLEQALEEKVLKSSIKLYKEAQHLFAELDGHHQQGLQARMHLLAKQLQELRDWQGFVTRPKQIELCEHMEYLASQHMEPEAKAERIRELQHEWRELGGSSDQKLWQRFKQASDEAYAPCHDYFSARLELKHANVHKRQIIADQLAEFLDNIDWEQCQWKAVEKIQRQARDEWRSAWPVDFRENRPVQKRFEGLMRDLDHHLDAERKRNEAAKRALVEMAKTLIDHEPLGEAMQQAKALQQEWQSIGITRQREDRKLWQAFRHACDAIFARRDQQRHQQQADERQSQQRGEEIVQLLQKLLDEGQDLAGAVPLAEEFRHLHLSRSARSELAPKFNQLDAQLKEKRHQQQLEARCRHWLELLDKHAEGTMSTDDQPGHWRRYPIPQETQDVLELCIRAEIISGLPSPEEDNGRRMQLQVNRLAEGLNQGHSWRNPTEEMEFLVACWCLQPLSESDSTFPSARKRLETAIKSLF